jgi:hypothetical protein
VYGTLGVSVNSRAFSRFQRSALSFQQFAVSRPSALSRKLKADS